MRRALALTVLLLALPAHAGLFDDDLARQRIEQLRNDVNTLTQRTETVNKNQIDFANQLESIRADLAKLSGQQEMLSHDLDAAQKRQKDFYIDLDNRLRKLESPAAEAGTPHHQPKWIAQKKPATMKRR